MGERWQLSTCLAAHLPRPQRAALAARALIALPCRATPRHDADLYTSVLDMSLDSTATGALVAIGTIFIAYALNTLYHTACLGNKRKCVPHAACRTLLAALARRACPRGMST